MAIDLKKINVRMGFAEIECGVDECHQNGQTYARDLLYPLENK